MGNSTHKSPLVFLAIGILSLCFLGIFFRDSLSIPVCLTIMLTSAITMGLGGKIQRDATGQPRDMAELPLNVPHRVEFQHEMARGEQIFALRPNVVSFENRALIPSREVIIYRGKLPTPKIPGTKIEYVIMLLEETGPELQEMQLNGFRVHGE